VVNDKNEVPTTATGERMRIEIGKAENVRQREMATYPRGELRHIDEASPCKIQTAIGDRLNGIGPALPSGPYNGTVVVGGKTVDLVGFKGPDGNVNVGRSTVRGAK
jgi:hypothetical protein